MFYSFFLEKVVTVSTLAKIPIFYLKVYSLESKLDKSSWFIIASKISGLSKGLQIRV